MATTFMVWSHRTATLCVMGGLLCAVGTTDCTLSTEPVRTVAYAEPEPEAVYVETVPANIETYHHESYHGADVYLVGGQWYRHSGNRRQNYRSEPVELGRRRVELERNGGRRGPDARERGERH